MIENVKKGMTIYFYQYIDSPIEEGVVKDSKVQDANKDIKFITKVNWENGTTSGARLDRCFTTFEEARGSQKIEQDRHVEELKSEITDLVSLLEFPLKHNVRDGEYCDFFAQKIYKEFVEGIKKGDYSYSKRSWKMIFYNLIKRKLQKAINTELHFDKGVSHIKGVDTFLSPIHKGWNLCIKYTTEDDYFYFTYAYNLRTILFLLFSRGVEGYTRGDSEQDYLSIM